jgi:hypothetical protein
MTRNRELCLLLEMSLTFFVFRFLGGKQSRAERFVHGFRKYSRFLEDKPITEDVNSGCSPIYQQTVGKPTSPGVGETGKRQRRDTNERGLKHRYRLRLRRW